MKYLNAYTFLASLVLIPNFSHAQIVLNEIMYDLVGTDTGKEWVEVYNSGPSNVDLSAYKFTEATTNHSLKPVNGIPTLGPGEFAILADDSTKFLLDWPNYSGNLFDSTFSLNNSGATLTLKDSNGNVVDQVTYTSTQGANGDGNTLQQSKSGWISALPTPGMVNADTPTGGGNATDTPIQNPKTPSANTSNFTSTVNTIISTHYSYIPISDFTPTGKYAISAGRDRLAVAGGPIQFKAEANTADKNAIYTWTFGDGSVAEGKIVDHVYDYPGDYVVILNSLFETNKAVSRSKVQVINPKLEIVEANPQFVSIKNNSKEEMSMFGFEMEARGNTFIFPQDTIILPGESSAFPSRITNVAPASALEVVLKNKIASVVSTTPSLAAVHDSNIETNPTINPTKKFVAKVSPSQDETKKSPPTSVNVETNAASPILGFKPHIVQIQVVSKEKQGWLTTLKHFLFGGSE